MNKEWSDKNKDFQQHLKKATFSEGISLLYELRNELMKEIISWQTVLEHNDFSAIPFISAKGYHNKTAAYSVWHIFRIEDIVVNSLIRKHEQIFDAGNYQKKINSPIITTGNELAGEQIAVFSQQLNIDALYDYGKDVKNCTEMWLRDIDYPMLKISFSDDDKIRIEKLGSVSPSESWLIDYWCGKTVKGLMEMPLSRHWIMHVEAACRIKNRIICDKMK